MLVSMVKLGTQFVTDQINTNKSINKYQIPYVQVFIIQFQNGNITALPYNLFCEV